MDLIKKIETKRIVQLKHSNGKVEMVKMTDKEIANFVKLIDRPKMYIVG